MKRFRKSEQGQDLAEYCLLMALVALIALGLMAHFSGGIQEIWNSANTTLASGSSSGSSSGAAADSTPASGH
jgi:Flp pilus assembly pilin Flp